MALPRAAGVLAACGAAAGHGLMSRPPTRNSRGAAQSAPYYASCAGYGCLWFSQGCSIGCPECTGVSTFNVSLCGGSTKATITDPKQRTFNVGVEANSPADWTRTNPWRAPGSAPVYDPCGMAGGGQKAGDPGNGGVAPPGHRVGDLGSSLPPLGASTQWAPGATVEVAWGIDANHGGGYQYRLCPKSAPLSEACFARTPLPFVGETQTLRFVAGERAGTSAEIPAVYVSEGTLPKGSAWARNPIPACGDTNDGGAQRTACTVPQFPPPVGSSDWAKGGQGLWGFGPGSCQSGLPGTGCSAAEQEQRNLPFEIVDKVQIPADLAEGEYVIGFRWDCEQTPQVWSSCGDVTITKNPAPPAPAPAPLPPSPAGGGVCSDIGKYIPDCAPCCTGACVPCRGQPATGACAQCTQCGQCWTPVEPACASPPCLYTCSGIPYAGGKCVQSASGQSFSLCGMECGPPPGPPTPPPPPHAPFSAACLAMLETDCGKFLPHGSSKNPQDCNPCISYHAKDIVPLCGGWQPADGGAKYFQEWCAGHYHPDAPTPPAPAPAPGPSPPAPPGQTCGPAGSMAQCQPCCAGPCVPCKQCVGKAKTAACDGCLPNGVCSDCYTVDPTAGQACMYDDAHGCTQCWAGSPPAPSPPAPAPPAPKPSTPAPPAPPPSQCPGGSLSACVALCPASPESVYTACCKNCGVKCPQ